MTELGLVGIADRGTYDSSATYNTGNFFLYEGSTYLVLQDGVRNITPSNDGIYYKYLAKGVDASDAADVDITDTEGLVTTAGEQTSVQLLSDALASILSTRFVPSSGGLGTVDALIAACAAAGTYKPIVVPCASALSSSLIGVSSSATLVAKQVGTEYIQYIILYGGAYLGIGRLNISAKTVTYTNLTTELSNKVSKSGDTMTGDLKFSVTNRGIYGVDSTGFSYPFARDNGSNLWIGAEATAKQHHRGRVIISAGHSGTAGYPSIQVCVPNTANDGGSNYDVYHKGNLNIAVETVRATDSEAISIAAGVGSTTQFTKAVPSKTGYTVLGLLSPSAYASGVTMGGAFIESNTVKINCINLTTSAKSGVRPGAVVLYVKQ